MKNQALLPLIITIIVMSSNRHDDDVQDIEYGFRDTRRRTTYEYRRSSSLTPRQIMERKEYTSWIYYFFDRSLEYLHLMVYLQAIFIRLRLFIRQWEGEMGENVGRAVNQARDMMMCVQDKFDELDVLAVCFMALAEIAYLHVEDLTVFICRRT